LFIKVSVICQAKIKTPNNQFEYISNKIKQITQVVKKNQDLIFVTFHL